MDGPHICDPQSVKFILIVGHLCSFFACLSTLTKNANNERQAREIARMLSKYVSVT